MSTLTRTEEAPAKQFWKELVELRSGMLGLHGVARHMQPMSPIGDCVAGKIWFFTSRTADFYKAIGDGQPAQFCIVSPDQTFHASAAGILRENRDILKIEKYWNEVVAAWFTGIDDPMMTLIELELTSVEMWASTGNPVKFGWEIMKANDENRTPDIGTRKFVTFD